MTSAPPSPLLASRPVISVGGKDNQPLSSGLLRLSIDETVSGIYRCEAAFGNWGPVGNTVGYLYFDRRTLDFGKAFQIKLNAASLFEGRIAALEARFAADGPPEITVRAEDRLEDLRAARRTRTFENVSDADLMRQVASDHGLAAEVDVAGPVHKVVTQLNQSDLHFLRERARSIDAELWIDRKTLHVHSHSSRKGVPLQLSLGAGLHDFTATADPDAQCTSLSVTGWDPASKSVIAQTAAESAIGGELDGGDSGSSIRGAAFGERAEILTGTLPLETPEAQARADAAFKMRARQFVTGHGVADTSALLRVGATLDLQGLGPLFNGKYYVTEVHHAFDPIKGMRTGFVVQRPGLGRP